MGDFDEMLSNYEKDGTRPVKPIRMQLFKDFLDDSTLMNIELKGCKFTWISNLRDGVTTRQSASELEI